jgi:hypothetical protein
MALSYGAAKAAKTVCLGDRCEYSIDSLEEDDGILTTGMTVVLKSDLVK